ncbi:putative ribonuclease H-like domain-containing protein [Tanacetum coccineum]
MHIEKNALEALVNTLLQNDKSKDTLKARQNLETLRVRKELWLVKKPNEKFEKPHPKYSFTPENRKLFCKFIKGVRLPDGFGSNFKQKVTADDNNITGLKSHDCHIMMHRLLPCGVQRYLPKNIAAPIIELCLFFKQLCARCLMQQDMAKAKKQLISMMINLEKIFPPDFFDIMIHLVIHLPDEAIQGGPLRYRWMFPFERYMKKLKNYDVETRFNHPGRNDDGLPEQPDKFQVFQSVCKPTGRMKETRMTTDVMQAVVWFVLNNSPEVDADILAYREKSPDNVETNFPAWFNHKKLVPLPDGKIAMGTKWILKNKRDARGIVVRNKARLVAQGHRQEEDINYDEVFAPVAKIEAIRLFLSFASYMGFLVYQMDVKSAFLYREINEEVYVTQPKGFEDPHFPKHVYKVVKALYGLHQAPRAWYARLSTFLLKYNYRRGTIEKTLFIKKNSKDIILVQVYVDDIIFGSTKKAWCDEFEVLMKGEFEMSAMGELTFFLGLQVKQKPDGIFISQDKYVQDMLKKFDMESVRTATTPYEASKPKSKDEPDDAVNVHLYRSMIVKKIFKYLKGQPKLGLWYPRDSPFVLEAYSDSDYAGSHGDRKSTTGGCQFLGRRLISWQCKKQTIVATSSTEAEYVAAANCCGQFWSTASLRAPELGPPAILATIDRTPYTITEDRL